MNAFSPYSGVSPTLVPDAALDDSSAMHDGARSVSGAITLLAGIFTSFTVSLVGEMPVGELFLMMATGWIFVHCALKQTWPGPLLRRGLFWVLLVCQAIALGAYVASDFYRGSSTHDMLRGWARMVFLVIDITAVAYLFGRSPRNLLLLIFGLQIGSAVQGLFFGALFGDLWKFGIGIPITYAAFALAGAAGPLATMIAGGVMCLVNFAMDFRSVGASCMLIAAFTVVQSLPRRLRAWVIPVGGVLALLAISLIYSSSQKETGGERADRSNIERSAMMQAAAEAFMTSPLIGHGSWFSNTHVIDNFMMIRDASAKEANVGGFAGLNDDDDPVAIHSQILVTLAEGGIFGSTFFVLFLGAILWALYDQIMVQAWRPTSAVRLLVLIFALTNVFASPFSGAHRVYIALAAGLILLISAERDESQNHELTS